MSVSFSKLSLFCSCIALLLMAACTASHDVNAVGLVLEDGAVQDAGAIEDASQSVVDATVEIDAGHVVACNPNNCQGMNAGGFIMLAGCCTDTHGCGLDLSMLGGGCAEANAPGTADPSCPGVTTMGIALAGCCRADGKCGAMDTFLGRGCLATGSDAASCGPQ